jgi:hypothetical protein
MNGNESLHNHDAELMRFHVFIHCGHTRRCEKINIAEIRSGIFSCPVCGLDGPLNVEIRELSAA